MTAYRNFIRDYPSRCRRLLDCYCKNAKQNDLEVTLLLNIATSGIILPYARLSEKTHPSGDAERFQAAQQEFQDICGACFLSSSIHLGQEPQTWRLGKLKSVDGDPDSWDLEGLKVVSKRKTVGKVLKVLRNALAHGNVFTRGYPHIQTLVFLSRICHEKPELGYDCLTVEPHEFRSFVECWLKELSRMRIPGEGFVETVSFGEPFE